MNYGDVPTWIGAVATFGALVAAIVAAIYASRVYQIEQGRDRLSALERHRSQAALIDGWEERESGGVYGVMVVNASPMPVRELTVRWFARDDLQRELTKTTWGTVRPGQTFVVRPFDVRELEAGSEDFSTVPYNGFPFRLEFRDSAGNYWQRASHGDLVEKT